MFLTDGKVAVAPKEKVYGLYSREYNQEQLDGWSEIKIYSLIASLAYDIKCNVANPMGGYSLSSPRFTEAEYDLDYLIYYTRKFGVEFDKNPEAGKRIERSQSFEEWYQYYANYYDNVIYKSVNSINDYIKLIDKKDEGMFEYMPEKTWSESKAASRKQ